MGIAAPLAVMPGFVGPDLETSMGMGKSAADTFYVPAIGYVKKRDNLVYGVGIYGQGGMGTEHANGDMAQVGVGRVIFSPCSSGLRRCRMMSNIEKSSSRAQPPRYPPPSRPPHG